MPFTAPSGEDFSMPEYELAGPGKESAAPVQEPEPEAEYADVAAPGGTDQGMRVRALYDYQAGGYCTSVFSRSSWKLCRLKWETWQYDRPKLRLKSKFRHKFYSVTQVQRSFARNLLNKNII